MKEFQNKSNTDAQSLFGGRISPNPDEILYVNLCFFTHINSSTEADVYDFLFLVDMTYSINKG